MSSTVEALILILPIVLISMSVHEMMHALASYKLGDDTAHRMGRISLNPLRHIDPFFTVALPLLLALSGGPIFGAAKPVEVNFHRIKYAEFGGAIVGMIGPLTNLFIALAAALLMNVTGVYTGITYEILKLTILINIGFFVFNSIPWPPLDGSRLLYAFAPRPLQQLMESIERLGIMGLVIFIFLFYQFLSQPMWVLIQRIAGGLVPGLVI
jgi:Zn-dependent protease